ncbi:hypothetical protein PCCS19_49910 [Paenibacillus sp. CCS19]|nr:hypothetical protein PCCS19_49910 [Paenibacillus cellulosilyticus]
MGTPRFYSLRVIGVAISAIAEVTDLAIAPKTILTARLDDKPARQAPETSPRDKTQRKVP